MRIIYLVLIISFSSILFSQSKIVLYKPKLILPIGHTGGVNSVCFSPDGRYILSGSSDNLIKLWDVETGKEVRTFKGHILWANSVSFSLMENMCSLLRLTR